MPIYEFACPKCRVIFNFFSKRIAPKNSPKCPKCGHARLEKQVSSFAMLTGAKDPQEGGGVEGAGPLFGVIGLLDDAPLSGPVSLQGKNEILKGQRKILLYLGELK